MKTSPFWPSRQSDQIVWLTNFAAKLPGAAAALGLTPAQVSAIVADCLWLAYLLQSWLPEVRSWNQSCTQALAEAENGTGTGAYLLPAFTAPPLPNGVLPQTPGALTRILLAAQQIKDNTQCTDTIATNLQLVGSQLAGPDMTILAPNINVTLVAGQVFVDWNWGGYSRFLDACEIHVDRGDGKGLVFLTIDTTPGYTDTAPLPATLTKWTYRAIYRVSDQQVGLWSAPVSITVPA